MVRAWIFNDADPSDQREPHYTNPPVDISLDHLASIGVLYWKLETEGCEADPTAGKLGEIRSQRGYKNYDICTIAPDKMPNFETKIKIFYEEHTHEDEEIRFVLEGSGYFDVRSVTQDQWYRIHVDKGEMLVLPAGIYHRFTLDTNNFIKCMRLFLDAPKWEAINRGPKSEALSARNKYVQTLQEQLVNNTKLTKGVNGTSYVVEGRAAALAHYPHMRAAGGLLYVSGASSRRPDNTHAGATLLLDGTWKLDISEQTRSTIENIRAVLLVAGADLANIVDLTVYLTDMKYYAAFNTVYNTYFEANTGPTRTTVAVHQLPHPNIIIEIKAVAIDPAA